MPTRDNPHGTVRRVLERTNLFHRRHTLGRALTVEITWDDNSTYDPVWTVNPDDNLEPGDRVTWTPNGVPGASGSAGATVVRAVPEPATTLDGDTTNRVAGAPVPDRTRPSDAGRYIDTWPRGTVTEILARERDGRVTLVDVHWDIDHSFGGWYVLSPAQCAALGLPSIPIQIGSRVVRTDAGIAPVPHTTVADASYSAPTFEGSGAPISMVLHCPKCGYQHVDARDPVTDWTNPPHRSHLCANCRTIWRPADVPTTGVASIETRGKADTWPPIHPGDLDGPTVALRSDAPSLRPPPIPRSASTFDPDFVRNIVGQLQNVRTPGGRLPLSPGFLTCEETDALLAAALRGAALAGEHPTKPDSSRASTLKADTSGTSIAVAGDPVPPAPNIDPVRARYRAPFRSTRVTGERDPGDEQPAGDLVHFASRTEHCAGGRNDTATWAEVTCPNCRKSVDLATDTEARRAMDTWVESQMFRAPDPNGYAIGIDWAKPGTVDRPVQFSITPASISIDPEVERSGPCPTCRRPRCTWHGIGICSVGEVAPRYRARAVKFPRVNERAITCPTCHAPPFISCDFTHEGDPMLGSHRARHAEASKLDVELLPEGELATIAERRRVLGILEAWLAEYPGNEGARALIACIMTEVESGDPVEGRSPPVVTMPPIPGDVDYVEPVEHWRDLEAGEVPENAEEVLFVVPRARTIPAYVATGMFHRTSESGYFWNYTSDDREAMGAVRLWRPFPALPAEVSRG